MLRKQMIGLMTLALSLGLTLTACGDDSSNSNNSTSNNGSGTDTGGQDAGADTNNADATLDTGQDGNGGGCTGVDDCADGEVCDQDANTCVADTSSTCDLPAGQRPERCGKDYEGTDFGPGSVVTSFEITGTNDQNEATCCFDYDSDQADGDPGIDNSLGVKLEDLFLPDINKGLKQEIENGALVLALEHDGLTDLSAGETYGVNFFLGEFDDNDDVMINPASIDQGTYPQARVEGASIDDDTLTAGSGGGSGGITLDITLVGTPLAVTINRPKLEASIDTANSSIEDGIALLDGKLGGVIRVNEILKSVNNYAAESCGCLGIDEPLVNYNPNDVTCTENDGNYQGKLCGCNTDADASACPSDGTCGKLASSCLGLYGAIPNLADVNVDSDPKLEAVSIGAAFKAKATNFSGVSSSSP